MKKKRCVFRRSALLESNGCLFVEFDGNAQATSPPVTGGEVGGDDARIVRSGHARGSNHFRIAAIDNALVGGNHARASFPSVGGQSAHSSDLYSTLVISREGLSAAVHHTGASDVEGLCCEQ